MSKPSPIIPIPNGVLNPYSGFSILTGSAETKRRNETFLNSIFADLRKHIPRTLRLNEMNIAPWSDGHLISHLSEPAEKQVWVFAVHIDPSVISLALTTLDLGLETFLICDCLKDQSERLRERLVQAGCILLTREDFSRECSYVIAATK